MRIFCRFLTVCLLSVPLVASAQVLARPGWAGSGVATETWWRRAVFYRIQPSLFQDSTGSGKGDLRGISRRLDYLSQLGVDAIVLVPPFSENDFGDLARAASQSHLRVMVQVDSASLPEARKWLNQGAAGLFLEAHGSSTPPPPAALRDLRHLTDSFPGERVLLTSGVPPSTAAQLSVAEDLTAVKPDAGVLHRQLASSLQTGSANPLLELTGTALPAGSPSEQVVLDRALALMLFASRAAVLFDAGRELGLRSADGSPVVMQWTPGNVTETAPAPAPVVRRPPPPREVYGSYTPFVPAPKIVLPAPKMPDVVPSDDVLPANLNTLPGFTTGTLPENTAANGAKANVVLEEHDPNSLLNFYRHLIALHHGNPTLRNGSQVLLDQDAQGSLVWVRRAPAGARTSASIVVACNLSEKPTDLALASDPAGQGMRGGLRPLLTASATPLMTAAENALPAESAEHLILPAYTLFVGEMQHEGQIAQGSSHVRHRRRRR